MPLNLSKLIANRARATIDFGNGDELQVEYYPARITARMLHTVSDVEHLERLPEERVIGVVESATDILVTLLASWDFVENSGPHGKEDAMPLDQEHIEGLGASIQWAIVGGILRAHAESSAEHAQGEAAAAKARV